MHLIKAVVQPRATCSSRFFGELNDHRHVIACPDPISTAPYVHRLSAPPKQCIMGEYIVYVVGLKGRLVQEERWLGFSPLGFCGGQMVKAAEARFAQFAHAVGSGLRGGRRRTRPLAL